MNPKDWKNAQKSSMWDMFYLTPHDWDNGDRAADIDFLKENLDTLIQATIQKDAGQRRGKKNVDWSTLDIVLMNIAIGAATLYLSGDLDRLKEESV